MIWQHCILGKPDQVRSGAAHDRRRVIATSNAVDDVDPLLQCGLRRLSAMFLLQLLKPCPPWTSGWPFPVSGWPNSSCCDHAETECQVTRCVWALGIDGRCEKQRMTTVDLRPQVASPWDPSLLWWHCLWWNHATLCPESSAVMSYEKLATSRNRSYAKSWFLTRTAGQRGQASCKSEAW